MSADDRPSEPIARSDMGPVHLSARPPLNQSGDMPPGVQEAMDALGCLLGSAKIQCVALTEVRDRRTGQTYIAAAVIHPDDLAASQLDGSGRKTLMCLFLTNEDRMALEPA